MLHEGHAGPDRAANILAKPELFLPYRTTLDAPEGTA